MASSWVPSGLLDILHTIIMMGKQTLPSSLVQEQYFVSYSHFLLMFGIKALLIAVNKNWKGKASIPTLPADIVVESSDYWLTL